jgi:N-acetylglucosamine-6-phosphate deacetylase
LPEHLPVHCLPSSAWLAPGFIDVQVNGGGDILFNDAPNPRALRQIAAAHRRYGTTGLLATLITDTNAKMRAALHAVQHTSSEDGILGIHFEGPFLSPDKAGVHAPNLIREANREDLELLSTKTNRAVVVTLAPERVPAQFIAQLVQKSVRVALGHSMATYVETNAAFGNGMTGITHLFNAMRPLESREPGPIAAALENANSYFGIIVDGIHVAPPMLRLALGGRGHPMLVTDAMPPAAGLKSCFDLFGASVTIQGECCRTGDGRLAGTALTMAAAVRNCIHLLHVPLSSALRFASLEPARFLGLHERFGRLAPGCRADMVALQPDSIEILGTWLAGKWQASQQVPAKQGQLP